MTHRVVFAPEADAQLTALYRYIEIQASPSIAKRFTDAILSRCEDLADMPFQGTPRDDIRPGMRTLAYKRRVLIAYDVEDEIVTIIAVFYGGQDFESLLREDS
jgi:plasmid stabilization system protein ParE